MMEALSSLCSQQQALRKRLKETQEAAKCSCGAERLMLRRKAQIYRDTIKDLQVQIDHLVPPGRKKRALHVDGLTFDFFERTNVAWADINGTTWTELERCSGESREAILQLRHWLQEGSAYLTDKQRQYMGAYYNDGLTLEAIGVQFGVTPSTVSRSIQAGIRRMVNWIKSRRLAAECAAEDGCYDYVRCITQAPVLPCRQRQLMLLVLSGEVRSTTALAQKLRVCVSTVSRALSRAMRTLQALGAAGRPVSRPVIRHYETADARSLAAQTNMPLWFYYRYCTPRDWRPGGMTAYRYALVQRFCAGMEPETVAAEWGLSPCAVRATWYGLRREQRAGLLPQLSASADLAADAAYIAERRLVTCVSP